MLNYIHLDMFVFSLFCSPLLNSFHFSQNSTSTQLNKNDKENILKALISTERNYMSIPVGFPCSMPPGHDTQQKST